MSIKRSVNYVLNAIKDPERDFSERIFIIYSLISELVVMLALIGDIIMRENTGEIITLVLVSLLVPAITLICLFKEKIGLAVKMIVLTLVFAVLPALFFFGGGLEGGGVLWFIFAFMYVGLVLSGAWRRVILIFLFILTFACYLAAYYHPELVQPHSREMFFVDSFISIILVGIVCFVMTWFQNILFIDENKRAKKEAERAEELTRAQNRFFSNMSHEIRTPINSILGLNELILRDAHATDEIAKDALGIQGAGKLLLALINDILDFSKMEAGSMDIVPVDYRVGDLISEIVNMIWLKAQNKGLKFDVSIDPKVPSALYGDEIRIKQVIINLLNNAVKYTSEGSIDLHIDSEEKDNDTVLLIISVSDTGMGIKKEALPYLFDAFKRVDEEKNRHIEGTGLGLSIVKQLMELMGGTITVNSVYGEGSTFTATLIQSITDPAEIGELSIHNQQMSKRKLYESSFKAPDAKILIVDDNEMNLTVEKKLLTDTQMTIDTVKSGREALDLAVKSRYDVILMDHLMPEMDGIECLEKLRNQAGGLNKATPVVVLTANAGSDNRELYNRSGFDSYLVKPVSGSALEDVLMKYIARDKLIVNSKIMRMREDINTTAGYKRKTPVIITTTSMCDLPENIIKTHNIPVIPFLIHTDKGVFKDGEQMDANELIRYIKGGDNAASSPPDVNAYTEFFASALKKAHHLIHIAITTSLSEDYQIALEAAKSFDNVTVINSEGISSSIGILVLIANKLAQQNMPVSDIVNELNIVKKRLRSGFIIDTTEYMAKKGLIGSRINKIARLLSLHPSLTFREDKSRINGIWAGSTKEAYKKYIHRAFPVDIIPDSDVVFITYVDVPHDTLRWIREEISRIAYFEHVVYMQASAAISSNCGPDTFGIFYFVKSNKSYNISSYFSDDEESDTEEPAAPAAGYREDRTEDRDTQGETEEKKESEENGESTEIPWYRQISFIDGDEAIRNSGSEDALKTVVKIFRDSVSSKSDELNGFFSSEDWKNYTVKVHALKSSARLIGASAIAEAAQLLENAGKEGDIDYIRTHHGPFMDKYTELGKLLAEAVPGEKAEETGTGQDKPEADRYLMESVYEGLRDAAEAMDSGTVFDILKELEDYSIPDSEKDKFGAVCEKAGKYDYSGMLEILNGD